MRITEKYFNAILTDLIDENPIACRAVLRISRVVFTEEVPTLAVTLSGRPKLCVNLNFINRHCQTEEHVKAVIVHEFLHVLLNHTEKFKRMTNSLNLALDAVINAIIHRTLGARYSSMMSGYYKEAAGLLRLLRPITPEEMNGRDIADFKGNRFIEMWSSVYEGELIVDDLLDIAERLEEEEEEEGEGEGIFDSNGIDPFLGNHEERDETGNLSAEAQNALDETLTSLNGGGIWRAPQNHGIGRSTYKTDIPAKSTETVRWEKTAIKALKASVTPDRRSPVLMSESYSISLPVLNQADRRGFLRSGWSPLLPDITWTSQKSKPSGTAQIYLDVSGSMNEEMGCLITLIWKLRRFIRFPFWAFSDTVEPAVIKDGKLKTTTSGGTSINSVLKHIFETKPAKSVIITDGFIESCDPVLLERVKKRQQISAIVSRGGSAAELERAGINYVQLEEFHHD